MPVLKHLFTLLQVFLVPVRKLSKKLFLKTTDKMGKSLAITE